MDAKQYEDMWNVMRQHDLDLVIDTSSDLECPICKKILINACTAPCRCLFCLDCVKEYLAMGKRKCPGQSQFCDIEEIDFNTDIQVNRVIDKRISKLSVKCPNEGCQSEVELNMIGSHLRNCEYQPTSCPYLIVGCEDVKLTSIQMSEHLSMEIHPHTKLLINWVRNSQNETKSMKSDIKKLNGEMEKLRCENNELKTKTSRDKEGTEKVIRELLRKENDNSTEIHRLNDEMCALKNSNRSIKEKLKKLKTKNEEQVSKLNEEVENQLVQITELKQRCELAESKCEEIIYQSEKIHEVEIKVDKISQQSESMKTETMETTKSIENIRKIIDENISGEFHWTINKWVERLNDARNEKRKIIFSDSFFTHKNGFKFYLALFPALDGNQMCINFHIEKGPFDELLPWPFDRDLELSLINPQNGLACKTVIERCSTLNPEDSRLQKPKTERNDGIWFFLISHQELSSKLELTNHNNEISIKLSIKPPSTKIKSKYIV